MKKKKAFRRKRVAHSAGRVKLISAELPLKNIKKDEHYLKMTFSTTKDNLPEIYDFLYAYLPSVLKKMGEKEAILQIERLEPLDAVHTNLDYPQKEIEHALTKFSLSHGLFKEKNILLALVQVPKLREIIADYNILFDLFFTDLVVVTKNLKIDMMDGFENSLLAVGPRKSLEQLKMHTSKLARYPVRFEFVDHIHSREHRMKR